MPIFRTQPQCLFDVVTQVIDDLELESKFFIDIDVPTSIDLPGPLATTKALVRTLIQQAESHMENGGELDIVAWESAGICELEVADDGSPVNQRDCVAPVQASLAGADVSWQNCPQGGVAVTARFDKRTAQSKAA